MIKVLIVDDSSFVRQTLQKILERAPGITVVGTASNGLEALAMVNKLDPDVVTLDIEMPVMDGLTALAHIMADTPCPVIMVSSLTTEGATTTLKALDIGAVDFIGKPGSSSIDVATMQQELIAKVTLFGKRKSLMRIMHKHNAAKAASSPTASKDIAARPQANSSSFNATSAPSNKTTNGFTTSPTTSERSFLVPSTNGSTAARSFTQSKASHALLAPQLRFAQAPYSAVCIGVSTGGPPAVQKILKALPSNFPVPILIAQHMPMAFTEAFAARLNDLSPLHVVEASETTRLQPGTAYVCRGGLHIRLESRQGSLYGIVSDEPKTALYKPSVNELLQSAALAIGKRTLGIILTGMGNDGLEGAKVLKEKGGYAIAQSEQSCVVYGMPKAIVDANLADAIIDIDTMATAILQRFPHEPL